MPPKVNQNITDDLIKALQDENVRAIFGGIFDERVKLLAESVNFLKQENDRKSAEINKLANDLSVAKSKICELEAYSRRDNLIISGLSVVSMAEAVSTPGTNDVSTGEHAAATEKAVLALCQHQLKLPITPSDISICHRLKKAPSSNGPPSVIIRFTNRKARDTVYAARRQLRHCGTPTYINEDLTKPTAELFSQTRKLVKTKRVHAAWTTGGNIYYKLSDQPNCKPKLVRSASDLP